MTEALFEPTENRDHSHNDNGDDYVIHTTLRPPSLNFSENGNSENFLVPEMPKTPRGKRPPTYGRASPVNGSSKKNRASTPPMSNILVANVDPNITSKYSINYISINIF